MNPIVELQERLSYSAIAGTALLEEDFRLKKIMDGFETLAQKNQVFGKIYTGLQGLFEAKPEERGTLLLNLLGLVDAILYTQAAYGAEGAFEEEAPLELGQIQQIRYSELHGIMEALTSTGGGRMDVLCHTIQEHPDYFQDYRVIYALIGDLADSYGEMAVLVFELLRALGTGQRMESYENMNGGRGSRPQLPQIDRKQLTDQLKRGFDPEGKTDMTRRMMLISILGGGSENYWYRSLLETSQKDIRAIAVYGLKEREENIPLLLELVKKERGRIKEMAYCALCQWDTPELAAFWEKETGKNPKLAKYLSHTNLDVYGEMAANRLRTELERLFEEAKPTQKQIEDRVLPWIEALISKSSEGVIRFYEWMLEQDPDRLEALGSIQIQMRKTSLLALVREKIYQTLVLECPQTLVDFLEGTAHGTPLAQKLLASDRFYADLLTKSAAEVYDRWSGKQDDEMYYWIEQIGNDLYGSRAEEGFQFAGVRLDGFSVLSLDGAQYIRRPLKEPLDLRWIDVFIQNDWEVLLYRMGSDLPQEWRQKAGAYFYKKAQQVEQNGKVYDAVSNLCKQLRMLGRYGWQTYDNLLVNLCKTYKKILGYQLREVFRQYQKVAGEEATGREAARVVALYRSTFKHSSDADSLIQILIEDGFWKEEGGN